jgi:hypothetical protein
MKKLNQLWLQHVTARNVQFFYIVLALIALAAAGGAPSIPGGN